MSEVMAMLKRAYRVLGGFAALAIFALAQPADALTMQQCSQKYRAAEKSGTLGGKNWAEFRATECGTGASTAAERANKQRAAAAGPSTQECSARYKAAKANGTLGNMTWNAFRSAGCVAKTATPAKPTRAENEARAPARENAKAAEAGGAGSSAKVTQRECSVRYSAAKADGTLGNMTWNEFRSAGCVAKTAAAKTPAQPNEAARAPTTAPAEKHGAAKSATEPTKQPTKVSEQECSSRYQAAKAAGTLNGMTWNAFRSAGCPTVAARRAGTMQPTAGGAFPDVVSKKYSHMPAGQARMLTCRDQYEANKEAGIAEPKWTEEGGGYYSECNKRLSAH